MNNKQVNTERDFSTNNNDLGLNMSLKDKSLLLLPFLSDIKSVVNL